MILTKAFRYAMLSRMKTHVRFLREVQNDRECIASRFAARVDCAGTVPMHYPKLGACHVWLGPLDAHGYGMMWVYGTFRKAHRLAWMLAKGTIPEDTHVLHRCDNPACVNPKHLFLGSQHDNMRDMNKKRRNGWAKKGNDNGLRRHPELAARGERQGHAKLTTEKVRWIRALCEEHTQQEVASLLGVGQMTVSDIVRRKTWAHVE